MDNFKMARDSVTIFRSEKHSDVYRYLEYGGRYMGLFWESKPVAYVFKTVHILLQLGLIAFAGYYYFQIQAPNGSDTESKSDPRHAEKFFMMQIGLRVTFALITYLTGLAKEEKLEQLRQVLTCLHVDDKLLRVNRILCFFVLAFLASLVGIDLYLLFGRMDEVPVLGSRSEFPLRAATKLVYILSTSSVLCVLPTFFISSCVCVQRSICAINDDVTEAIQAQVDEKRKDEMFLRLRIRYVELLDTLDELSDVFGLQLFVWLSLMFFHTCVKVFLYAKYKENIQPNQVDHIECIVISSVFDLILFSLFCYAGHGVFKERDNTQMLTRRSESTPCTQLLLFQMDLLNSDVDFGVRTASGHNMNLQLAFTLVGTVTTFAVVIIQIYMSASPTPGATNFTASSATPMLTRGTTRPS
ncbi:uncharacterized protein LOC114828467 [Galendromus occidentalis]|uniref:Uncharacterized protein LOC114828467 n=1 Tax=Galendromus occidentalis TaxID=34638 RepID=A0AAJ7WIP3_9ACAR|nr:uncharacterized protein LOC114828467 [Galendromus occidentalis]